MKKFSASVLVAAVLAVVGAAAPAAAADSTDLSATVIQSKTIDGGSFGILIGNWPH